MFKGSGGGTLLSRNVKFRRSAGGTAVKLDDISFTRFCFQGPKSLDKHQNPQPTMMSATRLRAAQRLSRQLTLSQRSFVTTARQLEASGAVTAKNTTAAPPATEAPAPTEVSKQAPNRTGIWAPSQRPRSQAMTGPRFEQTDFDLQVWSKITTQDAADARLALLLPEEHRN